VITSVLSAGEAAPWVLCSVLGPSLQERHGGTGAWGKKGNKAGEGSGEQVLWGAAEGTGVVVWRRGGWRVIYNYLKGGCSEMGVWSFFHSSKWQDERKRPQVVPGEV